MMTFDEAVAAMEGIYKDLYFSIDRTRYTDGFISYKASVIIDEEAIVGIGCDFDAAIADLNSKTIKHLLNVSEESK